MMKKCVNCKHEKSDEEFSWKNKGKNKRQSWCKTCYRQKRNDFYKQNKTVELPTILKYRKIKKQELRKWLWNLKKTLVCASCGEARTPTLQFHHLDPKEKDLNISQTIADGWSKLKILKEISKCKVLCANCHTMEHYNSRMGDWCSGNTAASKPEDQSSIL